MRTTTDAVRSEMECEKLAASVVFWDLGITDSITDKHRTYQGNIVIPVDVRVPSIENIQSGEQSESSNKTGPMNPSNYE